VKGNEVKLMLKKMTDQSGLHLIFFIKELEKSNGYE
jgi:hypothetical protein